MNLYDNSNIHCNKKIKIKYMIYIILFLINSFIVITNKVILLLIHI